VPFTGTAGAADDDDDDTDDDDDGDEGGNGDDDEDDDCTEEEEEEDDGVPWLGAEDEDDGEGDDDDDDGDDGDDDTLFHSWSCCGWCFFSARIDINIGINLLYYNTTILALGTTWHSQSQNISRVRTYHL